MATVNYLIGAGGGSGGSGTSGGGGGGAGGVRTGSTTVSVTSYPIVVGGGGAGVASGSGNGNNGSDSSAFSITSTGGGGGGHDSTAGNTGGSGGGNSGSGTAGQGNAGGALNTSAHNGGGGGAGAVGGDASGVAGSGGDGLSSSINGTPTFYGGGGGGAYSNSSGFQAPGGQGGGGGGAYANNGGVYQAPSPGSPNTSGGGGGATSGGAGTSGGGGSGIVIVSYQTGNLTATGGTITTSGSNTVHTFTANDTFVVTGVSPSPSVFDSPTVSENVTISIKNVFVITSSAGSNGAVLPTGSIRVVQNTNQSFTIVPNVHYQINQVTVDAVNQGPVTAYTFTNVTANHTISATFSALAATSKDLLCSLQSSGYKWLTSTLQAAQDSYVKQPTFKIKIVNDHIVPNQQISPTQQLRYNFTTCTAPDGNILAAGLDNLGNVMFYKGLNLHSGNFDSSYMIASSGGSHVDLLQRVIVKCSDWVAGTYHIDVWYIENFGVGGTQLVANHSYSDDGGLSFSSESITLSDVPNTNYDTYNLGFCGITPRWNPVTQTVQGGFMYTYVYVNSHGDHNLYGSGQWVQYGIKVYFGDHANGYTSSSWPTVNGNSNDWTIDQIDSYRLGTTDHVVVSGFRNFIDNANPATENFSLWDFAIPKLTGASTDVWDAPTLVFSANASIPTNANSFTYPAATVYKKTINGLEYQVANITFRATVVQTTSGTAKTTTTDYMYTQTVDGNNFSYPRIFTFNNAQVPNSPFFSAPFTNQGSYFYFFTGYTGLPAFVWEFNINNIVAEVSDYVLTYSVQDIAGQPSSISLQISNQNNIWVGTSPTSPGASAIAGGNKILLEQGYYNASGAQEYVPRNVYFIDDVRQNATANNQTVVITARDFFKLLLQTVTRYAYNFYNSLFYFDSFDGSTLSAWNQQSDTWEEFQGSIRPTSSPSDDAVITLANMPPNSYASLWTVSVKGQTAGHLYIYLMYLDSQNFVRLNYTFGAGGSGCSYKLEYSSYVEGITPPLSFFYSVPGASSPQMNDTSKYYPVIVRQHDYTQFDVIISTGDTTSNTGNDIDSFGSGTTTLTCLGTGSGSTADVAAIGGTFPTLLTQWGGSTSTPTTNVPAATNQWSIGLGCTGVQEQFKYFRYVQYSDSLSLSEIIKNVATKAGIFTYKITDVVNDYFFGLHTYSLTNAVISLRRMVLQALGVAYNSDTQISDGEIRFVATCTGTSTAYGFTAAFRLDSASSPTTGYRFHVRSESTGFTRVYFERLYNGSWRKLAPGPYDCTGNPQLGNLNIDLTIPHEYRVVFINAWMFLYIDGIEVCGWNDTNTTVDQLTTGYWGWATDSGGYLVVTEMTSSAFWKESPALSLNPGDDMLSLLLQYLQSVRGWFFSDLFGRLKAIFLSSSDPSNYTYQNQIYTQGVDTSSKEYIAQVTVYGNGVSATARNNSLMAGTPTRDMVLIDYTITTQQDAQTRANNELTDANQYQSQLNPKQAMNVGAEIFDVVTVVDTGSNSTNISSTTRVYSEKFTLGSDENEYSIELDTGSV